MAYLFGLLVIAALFVVLHFFTELKLRQKLATVTILLLFVLGAYLYNEASYARQQHLQEVLIAFQNGKTIPCDGTDVNRSYFSYSSGTQTFLGLKETTMFGRIISLDSCQ